MSLTVRAGALSAIVGGALLAIGHLVNLAGGDRSGTVFGQTLVLAALVLLVIALVALVVRASGEALLTAGGLIAAAGAPLLTAIALIDLLVAAGVLRRTDFVESSAGPVDVIGPLLFVLGLVLLGVGALRSSLPTGAGAALIAGGILVIVGLAVHLALVAGAVVAGIGFVWLGMDLLGAGSAAEASSA